MKKYKLFTLLAAVAFIATGCTKENVNAEPKTVTVAVSMPADEPVHIHAATGTRMLFEPGGTNNRGIATKWELTDKVHFSFKQGDNYFGTEATITSISANGKSAVFNVPLPAASTGFNSAQPFNLQCFYQNGGKFSNDKKSFDLTYLNNSGRYIQEQSVDLTGDKRIRPTLRYKHPTPVTAGELAALHIPLQHEGYVLALHVRNTTGEEKNLPDYFYFGDASGNIEWAKCYDTWKIDTEEWQNRGLRKGIRFQLKPNDAAPYRTIAANATVTLYRWSMGSENLPSLKGSSGMAYASGGPFNGAVIPAREDVLKKGTCVHLYVLWDGADGEFGR